MPAALLLHLLVGLLPVLGFLAALLYLDGYKLVRLRVVMAIVAAGVAVAYVCYFVNDYVLGTVAADFTTYSRYLAPVIEELGKALVVVALIRAHRVGFLIDAAIAGFAVGTGFAIVYRGRAYFKTTSATRPRFCAAGMGRSAPTPA